jgi:catechol 2,3-dioxygenase-like lactoylglutathione lyase family enzyme
MSHGLDQLLNQYETGRLSRRELLGTLAVLVAAPNATAGGHAGGQDPKLSGPPVGTIKHMNHVSIFVPNVQKSVEFYQGLFGMPLLTKQDAGINLNCGVGFLGVYPAPAGATTGSINHLCFGLENFDADKVLKALTDRGIKANIRLRGDTKELYFTDPDGIRVQLQDVKYKGGTGPLGDKDPK